MRRKLPRALRNPCQSLMFGQWKTVTTPMHERIASGYCLLKRSVSILLVQYRHNNTLGTIMNIKKVGLILITFAMLSACNRQNDDAGALLNANKPPQDTSGQDAGIPQLSLNGDKGMLSATLPTPTCDRKTSAELSLIHILTLPTKRIV